MTEIITPKTPDQLEAVRRLCWDYRAFLMTLSAKDRRIVETFYPEDKYRLILERLAQDHLPPAGALRLAVQDGVATGCGMVQTIGPGIAEIKRVYVVPQARGTGLGRRLMQVLIDDCRSLAFEMIRMDTGKALETAIALYDSLGFVQRGPYSEIPDFTIDHMVFFEMKL